MGVTWTEEQKKVISLRDRNILVSAGAGSGKTAVLVQRILNKIMDPERPVDIDRLSITSLSAMTRPFILSFLKISGSSSSKSSSISF